MKKAFTLFVALFFAIGLASAQDVYFSGNSNGAGQIWKNDTMLYSLTDSLNLQLKALRVAEDGTTFGAGYTFDTAGVQGRVWMNDSCIFIADTNTYFDHIALNGNDWIVAGFNNVWQNGELLYSYSHGEDECHIHSLAVDITTGDIYAGGGIYFISDSLFHACVWKNDSLLWMADTTSSVENICFDGGNLYAAGYLVANDSLSYGVIWQNDSIIYQIENANFGQIAVFNGSIYWSGISLTDTMVYIWQDGEMLYDLPELSGISNLVVNESGVYYTDAQTVYKDGEVLYQPEECIITDLVVKPAQPQPEYTLTVVVDSIGGGTVTGGGMYHYGDTATIEAIPDMGSEFLFWNDGIVTNPRDIVIMSDTTFVAHFNRFEYVIETAVVPLNSGSVTGGGTYHYGDTILLEAVANSGYEFTFWNDSITDNPRSVVVTQDSTFIAHFGTRQYTITVVSDHPGWGTVTGGGTFNYGDVIQIAATPYQGFAFAGWDDGNMENPRNVTVTQDETFTAHFEVRQCFITTQVTPDGAGTVNGGGSYNYGATARLTAHSNTGYVYSMWDDGVMDNPRNVFVEGDATYTAVFTPLQYEITTESDPEEGGTVTGAGTYDYGSTAVLTATANPNYTFICWSDGIVTNPRNITVTGNAHYKALFLLNGTPQYTVTVLANDPSLGTVTGSGTYPEGTTINIAASPNTGAYFTGWDDGNTDNPRSVTVTQNMTFTALFTEVQTFTITVRPEFALLGSTYGSGTYPAGTVINIGATPNPNFYFSGWQDGNMDNPRSITVTEDAEYSFFMDGGESSWAKSKEGLVSNIEGIGEDIDSLSPDFMILQEVDVDGTRTYHYDEAEALKKQLGFGNYIFSQNFDSPFLFWPITEPHGANKSGLLTGSDYKISSSVRRSLPVNSSLKRIVDLDRCYSITRFKTENGKELCIYDVHLSAYGSDASVREGQLSMLSSDLKKDADAGNYIICGGDFNHNLRGEGATDVPDWAQPFPKVILPSGTALGADRAEDCDIEHNSCRNSDIAYIPGTTFTVLADGFIVSDNVKVKSYASLDWEFKRSDHDPVLMKFELE